MSVINSFTTQAFGDSSLIFVYNYHPMSKTLAEHHFSPTNRYGHRALPSIHIIVKNGNVTLEGVVANVGDKNLINIRTNGVPDVFKVTNNLIVEK